MLEINNRGSDVDSRLDPQAKDGRETVLLLAAALACLSQNSAGQVLDDDGRFDFVAMLTAGTASPLPPDAALF